MGVGTNIEFTIVKFLGPHEANLNDSNDEGYVDRDVIEQNIEEFLKLTKDCVCVTDEKTLKVFAKLNNDRPNLDIFSDREWAVIDISTTGIKKKSKIERYNGIRKIYNKYSVWSGSEFTLSKELYAFGRVQPFLVSLTPFGPQNVIDFDRKNKLDKSPSKSNK